MDVVIVGGGASGIIASIFAKNSYNRVIVLEKNSKPLKKLLMTGNGKCNYMNEVYSSKFYHSLDLSIVDKILSSTNISTMQEFFRQLGIVPKIKNGYYYPFSNQAKTMQEVLISEAESRGVEIICNCEVLEIEKRENSFLVYTNQENFSCDKLVLATGGCSYPKTGSDGWGYSFLKQIGHTLVDPLPALVPLVSNFSYSKEWDGVRSDVVLELFEDGLYCAREEGEIQLTSYGISGICTFNLSHFVSRGLYDGKKEEIHINFVPFIETLITPWMDSYSKICPNKNLGKLLRGFLNEKIVSVLLKTCKLSENSFYRDLSLEEKAALCRSLRSFPIEIIGTKDFESAQISNGGVRLSEIDPKTMESTLIHGFYIIGELLDMNGNCGGYNLTTCWISGILAGGDIKNDTNSSN